MTMDAGSIPPMRWRDYVLEGGAKLPAFWAGHLADGDRSVLIVLGKGFDPRSHAGLDMILAAGGGGGRDVLGLDYEEGDGSASLAYAPRVQQNWEHIVKAVGDRGELRVHALPFWSGTRRVGPLNAANVFTAPDELTRYDDVVVDISAMPRGIYFPLLARLLFLLDEAAPGQPRRTNLHVIVADDPLLDSRIVDEGIDETAEFLHSFEGSFSREATGQQPKVWIPLLGEGRTTHFDRIYDRVKPDEICPVLPFPSKNPRRGDDIVQEYRDLLFDQHRLDPRSLMYAAEQNPFEVYRRVRKAVFHYRETLSLIGGCKVALSALSSKLMSLGALMVAYELKPLLDIGLAHVDCRGYRVENFESSPELFGLWLAGECYAE
ncbi:hypothetical protein [Tautonia sociabilis]|uniref:Uncharacterized protein n=1 Tax=Tautonia sociabilis TaxID=2080755 RepID=A0A432MRA7_9BACT|nr:hypothetical protein [Tautonia sociabilis]RUL89468.1 hypothetical protein TsocGM_01460 [Tautonia sociabilis]